MGLEGRKEDRKKGKNMYNQYKCTLKKGGKKRHGSWKAGRMQGRKERVGGGRKQHAWSMEGRWGKRRKEEGRNIYPSIITHTLVDFAEINNPMFLLATFISSKLILPCSFWPLSCPYYGYQDVWSTCKMVDNQMVDSKKVDNQLVDTRFTKWSTAKIFGLSTGRHSG